MFTLSFQPENGPFLESQQVSYHASHPRDRPRTRCATFLNVTSLTSVGLRLPVSPHPLNFGDIPPFSSGNASQQEKRKGGRERERGEEEEDEHELTWSGAARRRADTEPTMEAGCRPPDRPQRVPERHRSAQHRGPARSSRSSCLPSHSRGRHRVAGERAAPNRWMEDRVLPSGAAGEHSGARVC